MGMWLPNLNSKKRRNSRRPDRIPNPAPKQEPAKRSAASAVATTTLACGRVPPDMTKFSPPHEMTVSEAETLNALDTERVCDKPCNCNENKGSEPGHIHGSAPAMEQPK